MICTSPPDDKQLHVLIMYSLFRLDITLFN